MRTQLSRPMRGCLTCGQDIYARATLYTQRVPPASSVWLRRPPRRTQQSKAEAHTSRSADNQKAPCVLACPALLQEAGLRHCTPLATCPCPPWASADSQPSWLPKRYGRAAQRRRHCSAASKSAPSYSDDPGEGGAGQLPGCAEHAGSEASSARPVEEVRHAAPDVQCRQSCSRLCSWRNYCCSALLVGLARQLKYVLL